MGQVLLGSELVNWKYDQPTETHVQVGDPKPSIEPLQSISLVELLSVLPLGFAISRQDVVVHDECIKDVGQSHGDKTTEAGNRDDFGEVEEVLRPLTVNELLGVFIHPEKHSGEYLGVDDHAQRHSIEAQESFGPPDLEVSMKKALVLVLTEP